MPCSGDKLIEKYKVLIDQYNLINELYRNQKYSIEKACNFAKVSRSKYYYICKVLNLDHITENIDAYAPYSVLNRIPENKRNPPNNNINTETKNKVIEHKGTKIKVGGIPKEFLEFNDKAREELKNKN